MSNSTMRLLLVAALAAGVGGCQKTRHRVETFEWTSDASQGVEVGIRTLGTSRIEKGAGRIVERNSSPYRVGIYFRRAEPVTLRLVRVSFHGRQSGNVITPTMSALRTLGDSSLTLVAVAQAVDLPFEDYEVRLQIIVGDGPGARVQTRTGLLKKSFKASESNLWEQLLSA